ncbi:MAG: hypothetical protein AMJ75_00420 [Phycisphaerae bacterium SM1_79]|nr:MAG: hypothetical protein AMJ75_00420 [Phycisphaerae bacterium SM1_79]
MRLTGTKARDGPEVDNRLQQVSLIIAILLFYRRNTRENLNICKLFSAINRVEIKTYSKKESFFRFALDTKTGLPYLRDGYGVIKAHNPDRFTPEQAR